MPRFAVEQIRDAKVMEEAIRFSDLSLKIDIVDQSADGKYEHGTIDVPDMDKLKYKKVAELSGRALFEYIEKVIELAITGS